MTEPVPAAPQRAARLRHALYALVVPFVAAGLAGLTWDERYLITTAAWLLGGVTLVAARTDSRAAVFANTLISTALFWYLFVPPERSFEVTSWADGRAIIAFVVMAGGFTIALDQVGRTRARSCRYLAKLQALLVHAPMAIGLVDTDLSPLQRNSGMDELLGWEGVRDLARRAIATGQSFVDVELRGPAPDGEELVLLVGAYPVLGADGELIGAGLVARDVRAALALEDERAALLERVSRLQRVTASLAACRSTSDVAETVTGEIRALVGARSAAMTVVDGNDLVMVDTSGYAPEVAERWSRFPVDIDTPFAEAFRKGRLVVASSAEEMARRWSAVDPASIRHEAVAALPLLIDGEPVGAVGLSSTEQRNFDDGDLAFLGAVASQSAQALHRARLLEGERAAREDTEAAARRLSFLAEASALLGSSLDWEETLRQVVDQAVPVIADLCAVIVVDDRGDTVTLAQRSIGESSQPALEAQLRDVVQHGEPMFMPDISRNGVSGSAVAVPMRSQGRLVGAIALAVARPRSFSEDDLALAMEWASRSAQAIVNARLFSEREHVARTLQASVLPPATPSVPGLDVATRFFALGAGMDVGGDFYDVVQLGRHVAPLQRWAVVIGDVRGKGAEAAAITGAARHSIRASALSLTSPAAMLDQLNELLLMLDPMADEPRFCTAVVVVVDPSDGEARMKLAVVGHPQPLVLRADGSVEPAGAPGSILGVMADPELVDQEIVLRPGDSLVLYTDGVTERHTGSRFFDEEGLAAVLSRCVGFTASALAERIETAARAFVEEAPRDDLAIVVVQLPTRTGSATSTSIDLPSDTTAPSRGRRFVDTVLRTLGARDEMVELATLLASEVITNAVVHGAGPIRLTLDHLPGALRVGVFDAAEATPARLDLGLDATSGRGIHLLESLADRWGVDTAPGGKVVWFELV